MRHARRLLAGAPAKARVSPRAQPQPSGADAILRLQQTVGNTAVQRLIALQRQADRDAERAQRLAMAIGGSDWNQAATILLAADERWMVQRLHSLGADQLRYLDDAVRRMGVINSRLRIFIKAGLMQLGASDDTSAPGGGYGEIEGKATRITDGELRHPDNKSAYYKFEITFQPNAAAVDAELIEFIQMATVVSTAYSTPDPVGQPNPQNEATYGQDRLTAEHAHVDRINGMDYGWIGVNDSGSPIKGHLRPWRPGAKSPAWMEDTPGRSRPNVTFDFETAAICREGKDQGKVYATVQWGFTVDATMKVIPKDVRYFNKESTTFDLAVAFWNAEAAAETDSTQHPLPENLH